VKPSPAKVKARDLRLGLLPAPSDEEMLLSNEHPRVSLSPGCKSRPQYENIPADQNRDNDIRTWPPNGD